MRIDIDALKKNAICRKHVIIVDEGDVMKCLKIFHCLNSANDFYSYRRVCVGSCSWKDERKYYMEFSVTDSEWEFVLAELERNNICAKERKIKNRVVIYEEL